jgi:hypothetical protein
MRARHRYLCALAGYENCIGSLYRLHQLDVENVFAARILREADRAFSPESALWDTDTDRELARTWCFDIGRQLLAGTDLDPERDALGWQDGQALLVFQHNTPNNTLPLFWAAGIVNGRPWTNLFDRY